MKKINEIKNEIKFQSGFVALIGKPNVGKSTLLNCLLAEKISIVSDTPQTTRKRVLGILTEKNYQIIFVDTPGFYKPKHKLGELMLQNAQEETTGADIAIFITDAGRAPNESDEFVADFLKKAIAPKERPIFLIINKIDLIDKNKLLTRIDQYKDLCNFTEIFPISALKGWQVKELVNTIVKLLPEGPMYFPDNQKTEQNEDLRITETIREKILHFTYQEIPHCVEIEIETKKEGKTNNSLHISATIFVEKKSQRGILIGKEGSMLKKIGTAARKDIENITGKKISLELWVKIKPDWRERPEILKYFGYS